MLAKNKKFGQVYFEFICINFAIKNPTLWDEFIRSYQVRQVRVCVQQM